MYFYDFGYYDSDGNCTSQLIHEKKFSDSDCEHMMQNSANKVIQDNIEEYGKDAHVWVAMDINEIIDYLIKDYGFERLEFEANALCKEDYMYVNGKYFDLDFL